MSRRILVPLLALAACAALTGTAAAKTVKTKATPRYYLALGDSLSQGGQPNLRGVSSNTTEGYADDLYQTELKRIHSLQLVKLGCGGESTQSMITGKGSPANGLVGLSVALVKNINDKIDAANAGAGFTTADVATDFATYVPFTTTVNWQGNQIPVAVARICAWTWACSTRPSGPNIHANKNGYLEIANVFAKAIGKLS
jgi:hypothetical protein